MFCGHLLALPVHAGSALVIHLHAIHANVSFSRSGITRDHTWQRNESSAILRPAFQNGKVEQREIAFLDDLLTGTRRDHFGEQLTHIRQHRKHLQLFEEAFRGLHVQQLADSSCDLIKRINAKRQLHPLLGAKLIDQELGARMSLQLLEEQSGAARSGNLRFRYAVGNFSNFENWIYFCANALQFARAFERNHPIAQISV